MTEPRDTNHTDRGNPIPAQRVFPKDRGGNNPYFSAPIGSATRGRLRFTNGAHRITIGADSQLRGLCYARFGDRIPTASIQGGVVTFRYPRFPTGDWLSCQSERPAEISLNAQIPWDIEVRGGASRLRADLRGLRLGSFRLDGGASRVEIWLPVSVGAVLIAILGGASNVSIHTPTAAGAHLLVSGGVTNLGFDERHIGAAGGDLDLRTADYDDSIDRYDMTVKGGANNLEIGRRRAQKEGANRDRQGE